MESTEVGRSPIGVVVAIALAVVALAYFEARPLSGAGSAVAAISGSLPERSPHADEVEAEIADAGLTGNLEAALGSDFGGLWFEPSTAQLHVGVTSPAARRNAEVVAAQVGLAESVTATWVDSTWAELEAAQHRWDRRLDDLFQRAEVVTSLDAGDNVLRVRLGSGVAAARRAALRREAAADGVDVSVAVASRPSLEATAAVKKCNKFAPGKADCEAPIVAGVRIEAANGAGCSAGPAVILKKPPKKEEETETFVFTAGHCLTNGGGSGKNWYAFNKAGGKNLIGIGLDYRDDVDDIGILELAKESYWGTIKAPIPVVPSIAKWDPNAESDPTVVKDEQVPAETSKSCFSGERSGTKCGKVGEKMTKTISGKKRENVIQISLENGKGGEGDSGGPVFAETSPSTAQGVFLAFDDEGGGEGKTIYIHSLEHFFKKFEERSKLQLELLKEKNQKRHPEMEASKYPVTVHGSTTAGEKFTTEAGTIECKSDSFHAVVSEASSQVTVTPHYTSCTAAFGVAATISMEGCVYVIGFAEKVTTDSYRADTSISCPEGKAIKVSVPAVGCAFEVKSQSELQSVDVSDDTAASPKKDVTVQPTAKGIAYTVTQDGGLCPFSGTGAKSDGEYTSTQPITATGQNPSEAAEKIDVEVTGE